MGVVRVAHRGNTDQGVVVGMLRRSMWSTWKVWLWARFTCSFIWRGPAIPRRLAARLRPIRDIETTSTPYTVGLEYVPGRRMRIWEGSR